MHKIQGYRFFWTCSNINLDLKGWEKKSKKVLGLLENCIWIGCVKLSQLRSEYLWLTVNVLSNSARILHITIRGILQLNCLGIDQ